MIQILDMSSKCSDAALSATLKITKNIISFIGMIVPIILLTMAVINLVRLIMNPDEKTREQARIYWRFHLRFAILALFLCFLTWAGAYLVRFPGIVGLAVKGFVAAVVASGFLFAFFRQDVLDVVNTVRKKKTLNGQQP